MLEQKIYRELLENAFDITVSVTYWNGSTEIYGKGEPIIYIKISNPIPIKELTKEPTLVLGEAYMDGIIQIQGDIQELVASAYRKKDSFLTHGTFAKHQKYELHTKKNDRKDIKNHYDIGNEFYKLWLDSSLTYSCAYFRNEYDSLDKAQINKNRHVLNKLAPEPGKHLLDIGSGWGSLLLMAAEEYNLFATGITLSQEQYQYTKDQIKRHHLEDKVNVELKDYRDINNQFDYITSIGMFEHVGKKNLAKYFHQVYQCLNPDGRALIHGITGQHEGVGVDPFIINYIFPGGYIPDVSYILKNIMDSKLQLFDLESLRRHYQKTLELWYDNYKKVKEQVIVNYGERFDRMWSLYLQACAASFETGNIDVLQYLLTKSPSGTGLPMTRDYISEKDKNV